MLLISQLSILRYPKYGENPPLMNQMNEGLDSLHAWICDDPLGDVKLSKRWEDNYNITLKSVWSAVKLKSEEICCTFGWLGRKKKSLNTALVACPLVLLFTPVFVCSTLHHLLLYCSVSICIPTSLFTYSMSHLLSISPSLLLLHKCLSHVEPNTKAENKEWNERKPRDTTLALCRYRQTVFLVPSGTESNVLSNVALLIIIMIIIITKVVVLPTKWVLFSLFI